MWVTGCGSSSDRLRRAGSSAQASLDQGKVKLNQKPSCRIADLIALSNTDGANFARAGHCWCRVPRLLQKLSKTTRQWPQHSRHRLGRLRHRSQFPRAPRAMHHHRTTARQGFHHCDSKVFFVQLHERGGRSVQLTAAARPKRDPRKSCAPPPLFACVHFVNLSPTTTNRRP